MKLTNAEQIQRCLEKNYDYREPLLVIAGAHSDLCLKVDNYLLDQAEFDELWIIEESTLPDGATLDLADFDQMDRQKTNHKEDVVFTTKGEALTYLNERLLGATL